MGWLVNKLIAFLCSCSVPSHLVAGLSEPRTDEGARKASELLLLPSPPPPALGIFFAAPFVLDVMVTGHDTRLIRG